MANFAKLVIGMSGAIPGQSIALRLNGRRVTFTGSAAPAALTEFLADTQSGTWPNVIAERLCTAIRNYLASAGSADYDVQAVFDEENFLTRFEITAKKYGEEFDFNFNSGFWGDITNQDEYIKFYFISEAKGTYAVITGSYTSVNPVCNGSATGSATLSATGGTAPYVFTWPDGIKAQERHGLAAGSYQVQITDVLNVAATFTVHIADHLPIVVEGSIGNSSILISVTGGVAPYTFSWADGPTVRDRVNVEPGTYQLTVRDAVGCSKTVTFSIVQERFFFSKNPVLLKLQAASPETKPNLRFICEVWVEPEYLSGNFILATPEPFEHPADKHGATQFDVSEILDAFVEPHLPDFNQLTVKRADKAFKRFYLRYTEAYGDPVAPGPYIVEDNRYVVYGGLDAPEHFADTYFKSFRQNRKPFFTWEPVIKPEVFKDQPEYLYFMPDSFELTEFQVKVRVVFQDGSSTTFQPFVQNNLRRFELYCIPVGHDQLGLGSLQQGKEVRSWDVYVVDDLNRVLSETRRYMLDPKSYEQIRYFVYANSIGGYNTLAATGQARLQADAQARLMERNKPLDAGSGDSVVISKYSSRTLQLSTGYKSKGEIQALQDFLISEDVCLVGQDRYLPGRLSDKSATLSDDADTRYAFSFDFILTKMHRYTPMLRLAGYTDETAALTPLAP